MPRAILISARRHGVIQQTRKAALPQIVVLKLVKSFGQHRIAESLGNFRNGKETMDPDDLAVLSSYRRCISCDGFIDSFYVLFLASSEEVRTKFQLTDFGHQKLALRQSLLTMILFSQHQESNREALEELAIRHDRHHADIAPHLYTLWLETLCIAVEQYDPEFTPQIEQAWRHAMQPGIDLIVSQY